MAEIDKEFDMTEVNGMYYDINGKGISLLKWMELYKDIKYRRVGEYKSKLFYISTMWLGMNHDWTGDPEKKLIFETMVFSSVTRSDFYQDRYGTLAEALEGHTKVVKMFKNRYDLYLIDVFRSALDKMCHVIRAGKTE